MSDITDLDVVAAIEHAWENDGEVPTRAQLAESLQQEENEDPQPEQEEVERQDTDENVIDEIIDDPISQEDHTPGPPEDSEEEEEPPPPLAATGVDPAAAEYLKLVTGQDLTLAQAREMSDVHSWYSNLTDEQRERVHSNANEQQSTIAEQAPPPAAAPLPDFEFLDEEDQKKMSDWMQSTLDAQVSPLRDQLEQSQQVAAQAQAEQRTVMEKQVNEAITRGQTSFKDSHPEISEAEILAMETKIIQDDLYRPMVDSKHGDHEQATKAAFEFVMMTDETLQAKYIQAQLAEERRLTEEDTERKSLAGALSGGSSVKPDTLPSGSDQDPQDALLRELEKIVGAN